MLSRCCHSLSAKSAHHRQSNSSKLWFPLVHFSPGRSWVQVTRTHRSYALALNVVGKGKALGGKEPRRGGRAGADDLLRSLAGCSGPWWSGTEGWRAGKRGGLRWPRSEEGSLGTPPLPLATLSLCLPFLPSCLHGPGTGSYSQDPPSCTTEPSPCGAQTENTYVP